MTIQLTDAGPVIQTQGEILDETNATFASDFGADFELSDNSFTYRQNAIWANREAAIQSLVGSAFAALDLDHASGIQLDFIGTILVAARKAATRSTIAVTLRGDPGTDVSDKRAKYLLTGDLWRTPLDVQIGDNGTLNTVLTAENTGPLFATPQATTAWAIVDVTTGWASVESTADAVRGTDREEDPAYQTRLRGLRTSDSGTARGVRRAIGDVEGVTAFTYLNNNTPNTVDGVPAWHSEPVIEGGADADIGEALYGSYGDTTGYFGNTSYVVTDPTDSAQVTTKWSRITNFQVTAAITFLRSTDTDLPIDAVETSATAIVDRINSNGAGIDVDVADLIAAGALALPPGTVLQDLSTGTVAFKGTAPVAGPLVITRREDAFALLIPQPATVVGTVVAPFNLTAGGALVVAAGDGPLTSITINVGDYVAVSAATITEVVAAFSAQAPTGLLIGSQGGALVLASEATGTDASVTVDVTSSPAILTALGLSVGVTIGTPPDISVSFVGP